MTAVHLYESLGFLRTGIIPRGVKRGITYHDLLYMVRLCGDSSAPGIRKESGI